MNKIFFSIIGRILLSLFFGLIADATLSAQTPDLLAAVQNGHLSIRVKSAALLNTFFYPDQSGQISLDFYFAPDHAGNGSFSATPLSQDFGEVLLIFPDIPYTEGDSLSFSATETFNDGSLREYLFKQGVYRGAGDPITQCPIAMECQTTKLTFIFPSSIQLGISSLTPLSLFIPGVRNNGYYPVWGIDFFKNAIVIKDLFKNTDCAKILDGTLTVVINGITCTFKQGVPVSPDLCSPWSGYYGNAQQECAGIFENCAPELIQLLSENKWTLPCKQWIDNNLCVSSAVISRSGKVSIGTLNTSNAMLTVKNGIITDRIKVQLPVKMGWGDYVFSEDYDLKTLEAVDAYIQKYQHLPGMPSAADISNAGGVDLGEITVLQQVKIEEIYLYLIQLQGQIEQLEKEAAFFDLLERCKIK